MIKSVIENIVKMAKEKAESIADDAEALEVKYLYKDWKTDCEYVAGDRRNFNGVLYKCLLAHTSQETWTPELSPSLWAKVLNPNPEVIPEWEQPDSTNPYNTGDKVTHNGKTWTSDIDGNVWEPGVYGWTEVK